MTTAEIERVRVAPGRARRLTGTVLVSASIFFAFVAVGAFLIGSLMSDWNGSTLALSAVYLCGAAIALALGTRLRRAPRGTVA